MIGLKPKSIRSNGVTKCRRLSGAAALGPRPGNFASDCDFVVAQMFVRPSRRSVKPYAPETLIGPETFVTVNCADPFATPASVIVSTAGCLRYRVFVQR